MRRTKSCILRPDSQLTSYRRSQRIDNDSRVRNLLNSINPRALANSSPEGANIEFLNVLYQTILFIQSLKQGADKEADKLEELVNLLFTVTKQMYNHIAFQIKQGWIQK